jgi:hypothetical protein
MYIVSRASTGNRTVIRLRVNAPRNGQKTGLRWARDHEFHGALPWPPTVSEPTSPIPR